MTENAIASIIVDCAIQIHKSLGPGLLETVYEVILMYELKRRGLAVERQVAIPISWGDVRFEEGFRADLIVNGIVIIELKAVEKTAPVHGRQLLTYLRLTNLRLGLLLNFGEHFMKNGIQRVVNSLNT